MSTKCNHILIISVVIDHEDKYILFVHINSSQKKITIMNK